MKSLCAFIILAYILSRAMCDQCSVKVIFEYAAGLWVPQLSDGSLLDLAYTLARHL